MTEASRKSLTQKTREKGLTHEERKALVDSKKRHHRALEQLGKL
jgi:hypothetical protein